VSDELPDGGSENGPGSGPENGGGRGSSRLMTIVRYSGLGLEMGVAVGIGVFAGWWLDERFGSTPWGMLGGVLLGFAAAVWMIYRSLQAMQRASGGDA
jgi:ATP synthase protein I